MRKRRRLINETRMKKEHQEPQDNTIGTTSAEKARAKANTYTDIKREDLLKRGLSIIYRGGGHAKANVGRS